MLARSRVAAGLPSWAHKFNVSDIFHDDELTVAEKGKKIAARMKRQPWFDAEDSFLDDLIGNFESYDGMDEDAAIDEFDGWWDEFNDWADGPVRIWITTRT